MVLSWNGAAAAAAAAAPPPPGKSHHSSHHKVCDYVVENGTASEDQIHDEGDELVSRRSKRSSDLYMDLRQTRCPLLLVADYRFFSEMGGGSSKTTVNYLISLIDRVHKIYEETVWRESTTGAQGFSGMGFIIKKIVVHRKPTPVREGGGGYEF